MELKYGTIKSALLSRLLEAVTMSCFIAFTCERSVNGGYNGNEGTGSYL